MVDGFARLLGQDSKMLAGTLSLGKEGCTGAAKSEASWMLLVLSVRVPEEVGVSTSCLTTQRLMV